MQVTSPKISRLSLSFMLVVAVVLNVGASRVSAQSVDKGHILIADQFNNRVIEVDRATHKVVWTFGKGSDIPGPHSVVGTNDAERFGPFTLISGTGIPPSSPPLPGCSDSVNGCPDNRVFIVDMAGRILWQYGPSRRHRLRPESTEHPSASRVPLRISRPSRIPLDLTDQGNQRIILVNLFTGNIVGQYGTTGTAGNGPNQLSNPNSAEVRENGHILIADESNNRVIEITAAGSIVKTFTIGGSLNGAAFASRLPNGDTLITDSNNNRIVEVDANDNLVWQYATNTETDSNPNPLPTRGIRLKNGHTLISDQFNNRVIEVTPGGQIIFQQGMTNVIGNGFNQLNGPYDAKQIGDFTGLVPPFDFDGDKDDH